MKYIKSVDSITDTFTQNVQEETFNKHAKTINNHKVKYNETDNDKINDANNETKEDQYKETKREDVKRTKTKHV